MSDAHAVLPALVPVATLLALGVIAAAGSRAAG